MDTILGCQIGPSAGPVVMEGPGAVPVSDPASVPVAPANKYFVELIGSKFKEETAGGIYIGLTSETGEYANIVGVVRSVPLRGGIGGVKVGDEVAFFHMTVASETMDSEGSDEVFYEDEQLIPTVMSWSNRMGVTIEREYLLGKDRYRGVKLSPAGMSGGLGLGDGKVAEVEALGKLMEEQPGYVPKVVVDMIEGTFGEVESWIEKNKFRERSRAVRMNVLDYGGKEYWGVDTEMVFAVKRGDMKECAPGFFLCEVPVAAAGAVGQGGVVGIELEEKKGMIWTKPVSGVRSGGIDGGGTGMEFLIDHRRVPEYELWGMKFLVVREEQVMAVRSAGVSESLSFCK